LYSGLLVFGLMCLILVGTAGLLSHLLSRGRGRVLGRWVRATDFRCYLQLLALTGVFRFDQRALGLRCAAPTLIIGPNHPSLLDAVMVLSRLPNVACVMKAELINNPIYGASARASPAYIRNDEFIGGVTEAVEDLRAGGQLSALPGRNPHDAPSGESSEGRGAACLEALRSSHPDGIDRDHVVFFCRKAGRFIASLRCRSATASGWEGDSCPGTI